MNRHTANPLQLTNDKVTDSSRAPDIEAQYLQALETTATAYGADSLESACAIWDLAIVQERQGNDELADRLFLRSQEIFCKRTRIFLTRPA